VPAPRCIAAEHAQDDVRSNGSLSRSDRVSAFEKIWKIISEDFYDTAFNGADWNGAHVRYRPLIESAGNDVEFYDLVDEMLALLRDCHASFHRPSSYPGKKVNGTAVGFSVQEWDGRVVISSVEAASEAARAGVAPGMFVIAIDGQAAFGGCKVCFGILVQGHERARKRRQRARCMGVAVRDDTAVRSRAGRSSERVRAEVESGRRPRLVAQSQCRRLQRPA
jgi:Tricorn protease C1 domain